MSKTRISDILKNKDKGDEWYTLMAPQELHKWIFKTPWKPNRFSSRGVHLLSARVTSSEPLKNGDTRDEKLSKKEPWRLKNGLSIDDGFFKTGGSKSAGFTIHADGTIEFNEIMTELSQRTGLKAWDVNKLEVSNNKEGAVIEFKNFNPDGHGSSIYLYRITSTGSSKLYPDILLSRQEKCVDGFYDMLSHCTCDEQPQKYHGCAIEQAVKSKQIKLRKNKKKYGVKKPIN